MTAQRVQRAAGPIDVLDWRRRVTALYARVRANDDVRAAHADWRAERDDLFANHPASPVPAAVRASFARLVYAPYDPAIRFEIAIDGAEPMRMEVPTGTDGVVPFERVGRIELDALGSLDVWWLASYGGGVFLPMKDTNPATYGGGRYLLDTVKGADLGGDVDPESGTGTLVVDLNFAYNPSCTYDPAWACPLAPPGNTLRVPIEAGELLPGTVAVPSA